MMGVMDVPLTMLLARLLPLLLLGGAPAPVAAQRWSDPAEFRWGVATSAYQIEVRLVKTLLSRISHQTG